MEKCYVTDMSLAVHFACVVYRGHRSWFIHKIVGTVWINVKLK